jgi:hypothetical protein
MNVAMLKAGAVGLFCLMSASLAASVARAEVSLAGTWTLVAADVLHPDGTRGRDYGAAPKGLLLIDAQGHYSLQIFKAERLRFASGDKQTGTPAEYQAAVLGSSTIPAPSVSSRPPVRSRSRLKAHPFQIGREPSRSARLS